ncbi:MAG: hypothetical protein HXX18_05555 [Bacteroidetes bacterium]|jgi:hypothetical protein|nr:hypothetical protein [Bacteroidota bacterium]
MEDIFVPISIFAMVFGIVYLGIRKKERMELIRRGLDGDYFDKNKTPNKALNLKYGLLSISIGAGILIARALEYYGCMHEEGYFAMIFLLGGISLVVYYFLEKKL